MDQRKHLYHARVNAHLTLEQIGVRTALSPTILRNLDEGRFELLPSGVYARSYVRTFATAVGLDPDATLAELEPLLPGAPDPLPALNARDRLPSDRVREFIGQRMASAAEVGVTCRTRISGRLAQLDAFRRATQGRIATLAQSQAGAVRPGAWLSQSGAVERSEAWLAAIRSKWSAGMGQLRAFRPDDLAVRLDAGAAAVRAAGSHLRSGSDAVAVRIRHSLAGISGSAGLTRCGAAAIDALLLLIVDTFLVMLISWSSGIRIERLLRESGWALGAFCAIPVALYFLLFGGIAGSTLGGYVCSLIAPFRPDRSQGDGRAGHPLTLPDILRRTFGH